MILAQNDGEKVAENLVCDHLFSQYAEETSQVRKALRPANERLIQKINPLRYLATGLMFVYQNLFSEQISSNCTYQVSCSEMTKKSIERDGLIKGTLIGLHQLTNCSTSILHDHEEFEISDNDKIINPLPTND